MGKSSPQKRAAYAAWYRLTENGKAARKRAMGKYIGSDKWREAHRRAIAAYRARSKERRVAHYALTDAVRRGSLVPPDACERCGLLGRVNGHHPNGYDREHHLDVLWLCRPCHELLHPLGRPKIVSPLSSDGGLPE